MNGFFSTASDEAAALHAVVPGFLITICMYCGKELRRIKSTAEGISHGLCRSCKSKHIDPQIDALQRAELE